MGFFDSLWSGMKNVAGKIGGGLRQGFDWVKGVAGKVKDGVGWIKNAAGKISNIPIVGDILKTAWNVLPYTDKISKGIDLVDSTAGKVGEFADLGGNIVGEPGRYFNGSLGRLKANKDRLISLGGDILAPFRPTVG
jgi:hypothetical protein